MRAYLSRSDAAAAFQREGKALEAALAWGQAAKVANRGEAIEALSALLRNAELALHQAIYEANQDGCSWRLLGRWTDMSWQTLHRRYRGRPARMRPPPEGDFWLRQRRAGIGMTKPTHRHRDPEAHPPGDQTAATPD